MSIGDNLRKIRSNQDISQQEIADFLGVDRKTYVDWESGKTEIKGSFFPKLADYLRVEVGDFFKEKPGDIVINQHDNKDSLINGVVILFPDKEGMEQLADVIKKIVKKQ